MSRPTTKPDLIEAANLQFDKMWKLIDSMTNDEQIEEFNFLDNFIKKEAHWERDRNLRDVLIHLYEWHQLLLNWVEANQNNDKKPFLPEPYNWKTYGQMNIEFFKKHQNTPYDKSKEMLKESHKKIMKLIDKFSNDELFSKMYFSWTGTTALGSYLVSVTSSHYDWAILKIKKHIKALAYNR